MYPLQARVCASTRSLFDSTRLCIPCTRTVSYQKSYFNKIVYLWNNIPTDIRASPHFISFIRSVMYHFRGLLKDNFNSNNTCSWFLHCRCAAMQNGVIILMYVTCEVTHVKF